MDKDPYAEWVLFARKQDPDRPPLPVDEELLAAARKAWPHVLAHVRGRLLDKELGRERTALAAEVWDRVLLSVAKTRQRNKDLRSPIMDLESYLIGALFVPLICGHRPFQESGYCARPPASPKFVTISRHDSPLSPKVARLKALSRSVSASAKQPDAPGSLLRSVAPGK